MSIDPSSIKPGGKVSVTLTDGTKIIDAPVRAGSTQIASASLFMGQVGILYNARTEAVAADIASIDAYTPPTPEWARPEVYAVKDSQGDIWRRDGSFPRTHWQCSEGIETDQPEWVESTYGPCAVLAVYADGVER